MKTKTTIGSGNARPAAKNTPASVKANGSRAKARTNENGRLYDITAPEPVLITPEPRKSKKTARNQLETLTVELHGDQAKLMRTVAAYFGTSPNELLIEVTRGIANQIAKKNRPVNPLED